MATPTGHPANAGRTQTTSPSTDNPEAAIRAEVTAGPCDPATGTVIRHVVREALSNALQHGRPRQVDIAVFEAAGCVHVRVADDGRGLPPGGAGGGRMRAGYGVLGMRERVEGRGGRFSLSARVPGPGVVVEAALPRGAAGPPLRAPSDKVPA